MTQFCLGRKTNFSGSPTTLPCYLASQNGVAPQAGIRHNRANNQASANLAQGRPAQTEQQEQQQQKRQSRPVTSTAVLTAAMLVHGNALLPRKRLKDLVCRLVRNGQNQ